MGLTIDINADVGERLCALQDGSEEEIIKLISSANIACGGHAGDATTMERVLELCLKHGVAVGAHPGYPDRANFGRLEMHLSSDEIQSSVFEQVRTLGSRARASGIDLQHVKPHGALYNVAAREQSVAAAIAQGIAQWDRNLILVGLSGSMMLKVWQGLGCRIAAEAFVDRSYESDGTLRSRMKTGAVITDLEVACRQALLIIQEQRVISVDGLAVPVRAHTLCVHGDTPEAQAILLLLRRRLQEQQIVVCGMAPSSVR
ncbi:MAG: 5-oxoprolinase subunit PxpA [bacterium]